MHRAALISDDADLHQRLSAVMVSELHVDRVVGQMHELPFAIDRMQPELVLFDLKGSQDVTVRQAVEAAAGVPVIAFGDSADGAQVIQSLRAGALDFIDREDDMGRQRDQILRRLASLPTQTQPGDRDFSVVIGAQPGGGAGGFAVNLGLIKARKLGEALLVDCTLPASEAGAALGIEPTYTLWDASRDVERMDRTLVNAACAAHPSGLRVLPLAVRATDDAALSPESFLETLATIRPLFRHTILNVGGVREPQLLSALLSTATRIYFLCEQSITAIRDAKDLLSALPMGVDIQRRGLLVIDRYEPEISLTDLQVRQALGFERFIRLPASRAELLNSLNLGRPPVLDQPTAPYAAAIMNAVGEAAQTATGAARGWSKLRAQMAMALGVSR